MSQLFIKIFNLYNVLYDRHQQTCIYLFTLAEDVYSSDHFLDQQCYTYCDVVITHAEQ